MNGYRRVAGKRYGERSLPVRQLLVARRIIGHTVTVGEKGDMFA